SAARREQHESLVLAGEIEKVEQRPFLEYASGDILYHQRAGGERRWHVCFLECARRDEPRARRLRPDRGEVALAGAFRPREHHRAMWPARPRIDKCKRDRVRRSAQEILARKTFRMRERQCELTRSGGHQLGLSPV